MIALRAWKYGGPLPESGTFAPKLSREQADDLYPSTSSGFFHSPVALTPRQFLPLNKSQAQESPLQSLIPGKPSRIKQ